MISYSPYQWVENVCPLLCAHSLITSCAGSQTENKYLPATNKSNNSRCQQAQLAIEILSTGRILSNGNQMPMKRKFQLFRDAAQVEKRLTEGVSAELFLVIKNGIGWCSSLPLRNFFGTPHLLYGKIRQTVFNPLPKSKHKFCIQNYSVKVWHYNY